MKSIALRYITLFTKVGVFCMGELYESLISRFFFFFQLQDIQCNLDRISKTITPRKLLLSITYFNILTGWRVYVFIVVFLTVEKSVWKNPSSNSDRPSKNVFKIFFVCLISNVRCLIVHCCSKLRVKAQILKCRRNRRTCCVSCLVSCCERTS